MNLLYKLFFIVLFSSAAFVNAQIMDTVSYVPVKRGSYDKVSTKSSAQLATQKNYMTGKTLKANSSMLNLSTTAVTFGKPVYVRDSVFMQGLSPAVIDKLYLQGKFVGASPIAVKTKAHGLTGVSAGSLNMPQRSINMQGNSFMLDGITFPAPSCKLKWLKVYSDSGYVNVLGCQGGCTSNITEPCGNCGTCTRYCDISTGELDSCGACKNQGTCTPGATQNCVLGTGTQTCSNTCSWSDTCTKPGKTPCQPSCPAGSIRDNNVLFEEDGACCKSFKMAYEVMDTKVSTNCSAQNFGKSLCTGGVELGDPLRAYTAHARVDCSYRARGSFNEKTTGDGSTCGDENMYELFGNVSGGNQEVIRCNGETSFPAKCTSAHNESKCSYDGQILCASTDYSSGCMEINTRPCITNGLYCEDLESTRFVRAVAVKGSLGVYVCRKK